MSFVLRSVAVCGVLIAGLAACGSGDDGADGGSASGSGSAAEAVSAPPTGPVTGRVNVRATDTTCAPETTEIKAGVVAFAVTNGGQRVTELYVYRPDGTVVSERENIKPGDVTELTVELTRGEYELACKPDGGGDIRHKVTVTGRAAAVTDPRITRALEDYRAYLGEQVDDSIAKTRLFAEAVKKGDVATAKDLYAPSRVGWERIEPVAEAFGDIDPKVDLREADLEEGQTWTGWHRLEKALWQAPDTLAKEAEYADRLLADQVNALAEPLSGLAAAVTS